MPVAGIPPKARDSSDRWTLIAAVAASLLLVTLAVLQYRWTGELSAAANERMRANLEESSRLLANDIDAPVAQLHASFQRIGRRTAAAGAWLATRDEPRRSRDAAGTFGELLARAVRDWRESAAFPDLLDETWIVVIDRREGTRDVFRLDEDGGRFQPGPGPDDLEDPGRPLRRPDRRLADARPDRLVIPVSGRMPGGQPGPPATLIVASLDVSVLEQEMLPALIERRFGAGSPGEAPPYLVSVADVSGPVPRLIYPDPADAPGYASTTPSGPADIEFRAWRTRPLPERRDGSALQPINLDEPRRFPSADRDGPQAPSRSPSTDRNDPRRVPRDERTNRDDATERDRTNGAWLVRITHRRGSLEAATEAARRRNLYVSSGALFLIGVAFALVLVSARRARALAAQQVDFVAGVSHELNTPLQAIRQAAENLSTGIVHASDDVRGYGELIEREGRRLSRLVAQALQWAGIGRSSARKATTEIDLGELLRTAVAESKWFLEENGVELELEGLDGLPSLRGDREGLITVFMNLLHNAAKYGRDADGAVRVRIDASGDADGRGVSVAVTDRGPGIPKAEQRRIFDPFVRGLAATESALPGSGLGLSLARNAIEEHGGSITVDSEPGRTTFRVVLPVNGA